MNKYSNPNKKVWTRQELIDAVNASPNAVARHDKQAWINIFAESGIIEDPVGTSPSRRGAIDGRGRNLGDSQLEQFYETFIAPNDIRFQVAQDIVVENMVVRDAVIAVKSPGGMEVNLQAYILYELTTENEQLKVARLAAHWELGRMTRQVLGSGWPGIKMMLSLSMRMLRIQGIRGLLGYGRGFFGVGKRGKESVRRFVEAVDAGDPRRLAVLFSSPSTRIEFPVGGQTYDPASFLDSVGIRISVSEMISAGFVVSFRFGAATTESTYEGIGMFSFDRNSRKITSARFFRDDTAV